MSIVGRVREIWRYPVKSIGGEELDRCDVGLRGIHGDRGWALRDEQAGKVHGGKTLPKLMQCHARYLDDPKAEEIPHVEVSLPDGTKLRSDDRRTSERLSEFLGRRVTLWTVDPATYVDVSSLSLLTTASITTLSALNPQSRLDVRRFRPNFYVETPKDSEGFVELEWSGKALEIGALRVNCKSPAPRCGMTTYEQPGLPEDPSILRTIVRQADHNVGIYASPACSGSVSVDDPVQLIG